MRRARGLLTWGFGWGMSLALALLALGGPRPAAAPAPAAAAPARQVVWAWGWDADPSVPERSGAAGLTLAPVQVTDLSNVVALAAGHRYALALGADGAVWAWGHNDFGRLGVGSTEDSRLPLRVSGLEGVTAVAAGGLHALALARDGTVWGWGYNGFGQLGARTGGSFSATPVRAVGLNQVTAVAAGAMHSLALRADGTVWAWGRDNFGQLGAGMTADSDAPLQMTGLKGIVAIAAGSSHSLALRADGTVWAWGRDDFGQLGDGARAHSNRPVRVAGLAHVTAITAAANHSLALRADGSVWAWGWNTHGQLGDGGDEPFSVVPRRVVGLSGVTAIAAGGMFDDLFDAPGHSLALTADGGVWAWGWNGRGQLGDATTLDRRVPVRIASLPPASAIAAGGVDTLALTPAAIRLASDAATPARLTVRAGTSVTWTNDSAALHDLVGDDDAWRSGPLLPGQTMTRLFERPGRFAYACTLHPDVRGTLVVTVAKPSVTRAEDTSPAITYSGRWRRHAESGASGGTLTYSDESAPGEATLQWVGTDVTVLMARGPQMGMAWVTVDDDGALVDLYAPALRYRQAVLVLTDLPPGPHLVRVAPVTQRNARASGGLVALDAIETR